MKTTVEMPDALFRRAKSAAAQRGIPFRQLVTEALSEKLAEGGTGDTPMCDTPICDTPWMASFGKLKALRRESARIDRLVSATFERFAETVSTLPENQRRVLVLRDVEGWTSEEVCELLELSEVNQRVLLHRARSKLRALLEGELGGGR